MRLLLVREKGFTLIELLVVISIIGLLSSIVLASLNSARENAQEAKFSAELHSLTTALELEKNKTGYYPLEQEADASFEADGHTGAPYYYGGTFSSVLAPVVSHGFIPQLPTLPSFITDANYFIVDPKYDDPNFTVDPYETCGNVRMGRYMISFLSTKELKLFKHVMANLGDDPSGMQLQAPGYCITSGS